MMEAEYTMYDVLGDVHAVGSVQYTGRAACAALAAGWNEPLAVEAAAYCLDATAVMPIGCSKGSNPAIGPRDFRVVTQPTIHRCD